MPTGKLKNTIYRLALPVSSPSSPPFPPASVNGHPLLNPEELASIVRRNHITGGAFLLESENGSVSVFTRSFHTSLVPDENTFFRVASITKMATALLAFRLMDMGILDPEIPVSSLLPCGEDVPELKGIMISHLLSHTSGLKDPDDLEQLLNLHRPYPFAISGCRISGPGESFCYSNLGYGLIGCVFESVLGKPLPQIYREYLFEPLGMNASLEGCSLPSRAKDHAGDQDTSLPEKYRSGCYRARQDSSLCTGSDAPLRAFSRKHVYRPSLPCKNGQMYP